MNKIITFRFLDKDGNEVTGIFKNITKEEFETRILELGYVKPKWYQLCKHSLVVLISYDK